LYDGQLSGDILMLEVMEKYGWSYYTYLDQPTWVIELIQEKMRAEARLAKKAAEQTG
jgi:uncharacterized protein YaaN involved in tellurite resistance